jgi:hypothetical protein
MTSSKKSFDEYMKVHTAQKGSAFTHTRIPDKTLNIFGGLYNIASNEWNDFIKRYYTHVFVNGNMEYLTEKQLIENGPILIDIDLRYDKSITQKQHTEEHIRDMVMLYAEKISELVQIKDNSNVDVFVMEKNNVNILEDKTKDGIHVIICIKMHKALQVLLRNKVIDELRQIWDDLPVTNTWDNILDEGVTKGFVNWQLYGSRKPAHLAYLIKYHYVLNYSVQNYGWSIQLKDLSSFSTEHNMEKLSAQYTEHIEFDIIERVHNSLIFFMTHRWMSK